MVLPPVFKSLGSAAYGLVSDATHLYAATGGQLRKISLTDSSDDTVIVASGVPGYAVLTMDNTYVYVLGPNDEVLQRFSKAGVLDSSFTMTVGGNYMLVKDTKLYIASVGGGSVSILDLPTKALTSNWVTGLAGAGGLTFVGSSLYVACSNGIKKLTINSDGTGTIDTGFVCNVDLGGDIHAFVSVDTDFYVANRGGDGTQKLSKITISTGVVAELAFVTLPGHIRGVTAANRYLYVSNDGASIYKIYIEPALTPLYLGKTTVSGEGNMSFGSAAITTNKLPTDPHHLVPKAYVDKYNADILAYLAKVLDGNGLTDILTRLSDLEEQVNRTYLATWNVPRNTPVISTIQNPSLVFNSELHRHDITGTNADLIANPPTAPDAPSDIGTGFI